MIHKVDATVRSILHAKNAIENLLENQIYNKKITAFRSLEMKTDLFQKEYALY